MKEDFRSSIAAVPRIALLLSFTGSAACTMTGCSAVPDWSQRDAVERRVEIEYAPRDNQRRISIPSSSEHLLILELSTMPPKLEETFEGDERLFVLPASKDRTRIRCRYRLFRRYAPDGTPMPWESTESLFPGGRVIRGEDLAPR